MTTIPEKLTLQYWQTEIKSDEYWCQVVSMQHKEKSLDRAISEGFTYLLADNVRLQNMDQSDMKRFLAGWIQKMPREKTMKNAKRFQL